MSISCASAARYGPDELSSGGAAVASTYVALVDDDASLAGPLRHVLREAIGAEAALTQFLLAQPALESFAARRPDIILLDIGLPDVNGIDVLRMLKADPALRAIPVIMMTAKAQWDTVAVALDAGADAYIFKPFDGRTLTRTIAEADRARRSALRTP